MRTRHAQTHTTQFPTPVDTLIWNSRHERNVKAQILREAHHRKKKVSHTYIRKCLEGVRVLVARHSLGAGEALQHEERRAVLGILVSTKTREACAHRDKREHHDIVKQQQHRRECPRPLCFRLLTTAVVCVPTKAWRYIEDPTANNARKGASKTFDGTSMILVHSTIFRNIKQPRALCSCACLDERSHTCSPT